MGFLGYSRKNLMVAVSVAVLVHLVLLSIPIIKHKVQLNTETVFEVTFLEQVIVDKAPLEETVSVNDSPITTDQKEPDTKPAKPVDQRLQVKPEIIVAEKRDQPTPRIKVDTSVSSTAFKAWLETETQTFTSSNPELVDKFDDSFSPKPIYKSPPELSPDNPKSRPAGSTTFAVEKNGRRTCMAKIINMLDASAGPSFVSRDCTPPKKFELDMNKPNNGWMDR